MRYLTMARSVATLAIFAALAGCDDDPVSPEGEHAIRINAVTTGTAFEGDASQGVTSVEAERVVLVLGMVKLETAGVDETVDFVDERSVVVPLDLDGDAVLAFDADAPAGTYKELELSIDKLEPGNPLEAALIAAHPDLENASVMVEGTVTRDGVQEAFSIAYDADIDLELDLAPPLVIAPDGDRVTTFSLVIDLSGWFVGDSGALLDPTLSDNRSAIMANIEQSIDVLED
ncbi:MAG TPA: hypothetical protein VMN78_04820 [Longimicrobiales bacterium]|nr:hypothetical protein [Longimicrobiales bacterium]